MTEPTDANPPSDAERHNAKMARKKQARDKIMATKTDEKDLSSFIPARARESHPPPSG